MSKLGFSIQNLKAPENKKRRFAMILIFLTAGALATIGLAESIFGGIHMGNINSALAIIIAFVQTDAGNTWYEMVELAVGTTFVDTTIAYLLPYYLGHFAATTVELMALIMVIYASTQLFRKTPNNLESGAIFTKRERFWFVIMGGLVLTTFGVGLGLYWVIGTPVASKAAVLLDQEKMLLAWTIAGEPLPLGLPSLYNSVFGKGAHAATWATIETGFDSAKHLTTQSAAVGGLFVGFSSLFLINLVKFGYKPEFFDKPMFAKMIGS